MNLEQKLRKRLPTAAAEITILTHLILLVALCSHFVANRLWVSLFAFVVFVITSWVMLVVLMSNKGDNK